MRGQSGMTLLEVLVALMMLALTGLLLAEGLNLGTRIWDRAGAAAGTAMVRFDTARTVRRIIEQAEPGITSENPGIFSGNAHSLSLMSFDAAQLAGGRGRRLELSRDGGIDAVMLRIVDMEGLRADENLMLFDKVSDLSLRYFGHDAARKANEWRDHWTDGVDLPLLVAVRIDFSDGATPLVLTVAPRKRYSIECLAYGQRACAGATQ